MTGTNDRRISGGAARKALAAACLAVALAGCGSDSESTRIAKVQEAIRVAAAAGQGHATDTFYDKVAGTSVEDLAPADFKKQLTSKDAWKAYVQAQETDAALSTAAKLLADALSGDVPPDSRATIQGQAGNVAMRQAELRLGAIQADLAELGRQSLGLQQETQAIATLLIEADAQHAAATPPDPAPAAAARAALDKCTTETAAAQQTLNDLQSQINAKMDQAKQLAAKADTDLKAADALKGQEAIDAAAKANATQSAANAAIEAAAKLEPALAQARGELDLAQTRQKQADDSQKAAAAGLEQAQKAADAAAAQATALRAKAKAAITDAGGISDHYAAFNKLAAELDKKISGGGADKGALAYAEQAERAYADAGAQWTSYKGKIGDLNLDSGDPLVKAVTDQRAPAILKWSQALANERCGRINLAGYLGAGLQTTVTTLVSNACKAAGAPDIAAKPALDAAKYKTAAATRFASARTLAETPPGPQVSGMLWLGNTVQAVALQGTYLLTGAKADQTAMLDAAKKASDANPSVKAQMDGLTAAQ